MRLIPLPWDILFDSTLFVFPLTFPWTRIPFDLDFFFFLDLDTCFVTSASLSILKPPRAVRLETRPLLGRARFALT